MISYSQSVVDLLDRKFNFLVQSRREDFMLDLTVFLDFLLTHEPVKPFTMKIYSVFSKSQEVYNKLLAEEQKKIVALGTKIRTRYPELDDSKKPKQSPPPTHPLPFEDSFAGFDRIIKGEEAKSFSLAPDQMTDDSIPRKLLRIIYTKFQEYEGRDAQGKPIRQIDESIRVEYFNLDEQREHNFKKWLNSRRVSAGQALVNLCRVASQINPEPEQYKSIDERFKRFTSLELWKSVCFENWIQDATYGVISRYSNHKPAGLDEKKLDSIFEKLKYEARRIYEAVRQEISTALLHRQILNRYKTRCMWYDFEEMWNLVSDPKGNFVSDREKKMTLHLARFLFDNGVSVIYRMRAGQHEMDMVDPDATKPLLIEAKVYKDSGTREEIIEGIAQLHSYLNNLSASKDINEAYYVVYRFGGPLYELPEEIPTNRFLLSTILIDVGKSRESGSRQPKPVIISKDEIVRKFEKPRKRKAIREAVLSK